MKKNELSCKDLMIGDWVMVYPWDETPWEPKKITDINFHSWEGTDYCDSVGVEGWDELSLDEIKPIPLTDEILKKNGWEIGTIPDICNGTEDWAIWPVDSEIEIPFRLQRGYDGHRWWIVVGIGGLLTHIDYVHEFQHALRLCRIEKTIEL